MLKVEILTECMSVSLRGNANVVQMLSSKSERSQVLHGGHRGVDSIPQPSVPLFVRHPFSRGS